MPKAMIPPIVAVDTSGIPWNNPTTDNVVKQAIAKKIWGLNFPIVEILLILLYYKLIKSFSP